jgi:hypothetical protein
VGIFTNGMADRRLGAKAHPCRSADPDPWGYSPQGAGRSEYTVAPVSHGATVRPSFSVITSSPRRK